MDDHLRDFQARLHRIERSRGGPDHGLLLSHGHDGLIIARRRRRRGLPLPLHGLFLVVAVVLGFKGLVHAHLGPATYADRVAGLAAGNGPERVAAVLMAADPVTLWLSDRFTEIGF